MFRTVCVAVILILACTAGAAPALQLDPEKGEATRGAGLLDGLWEKLVDWFGRIAGGEGGDGLSMLQTEGCHLDPNGTSSCGGGN